MTNSLNTAQVDIARFVEGAAAALISRDAQETAGLCYLAGLLGTCHVHLSIKGKGNKPKLGVTMQSIVDRVWEALPAEAKFNEGAKAALGAKRGIKVGSLKSYLSTLNQLIDVNGKRYQQEFSDAARRGDVPAMQEFLRGKGVFSYTALCALGKAKGKGSEAGQSTPLTRAVSAVRKLQKAGKKELSPEGVLLLLAKELKCLPALKRLTAASR